MPLLQNVRVLAAEEEAVEGTQETMVDADAIEVLAPVFSEDTELHERNVVSDSFSRKALVVGRRPSAIDFEAEIRGSGTPGTAPKIASLIKACGFSETVDPGVSVIYAPVTAIASIPSLTIDIYLDGVRKRIWGARGNMAIRLVSGQPGMLVFHFEGADYSVSDVANLVLTAETTKPPPFLSSALALDTGVDNYSPLIENMNIDMANVLQRRSDVNKASGFLSALITGRRPVGDMDMEHPTVAEFSIFDKKRAGDNEDFTTKIGTVAGNICTLTGPAMQWGAITEGGRGGVALLNAPFLLNEDSGDDEISAAFT